MNQQTDVLLIGGGVASVRCARTLRREGYDGRILIVGDEPTLPYNRPPLSKELLREDLPDDLVLAEPEAWYARRNVELLAGRAVVQLDAEDRTVALDGGERIGFERCLIVTGADPVIPPIPGGDLGLVVRTLADARRLRTAALGAPRGARVVVVGGGLIGVEVASGLAALGLRPVLVEQAEALWAGALGQQLADWARDRLDEVGVEVRLESRVSRLEADAAWIGEEKVESAFTVIGVGVRPRTGLAERAGILTDDGILTDGEHRTSHPAVWAAGDVARMDGVRFEHWHAAREGGERSARSMLGTEVPPRRAPWLFTEVAGAGLDVFGRSAGADVERAIGDRVFAYLEDERVIGLAVIDGALGASEARALVEAESFPAAVHAALAASGGE